MKIRGNFIGATIVTIIYTVYILLNLSAIPRFSAIALLIILNALLIILMYYAFNENRR